MYTNQNQPAAIPGACYTLTVSGALSPKEDAQIGPTAIRDRITGAESLMSDLHNAIDALEKRLDTVLIPVPPATGSGQGAGPSAPISHVRGRLELLNEGTSHAIQRLQQLAQRVDV